MLAGIFKIWEQTRIFKKITVKQKHFRTLLYTKFDPTHSNKTCNPHKVKHFNEKDMDVNLCTISILSPAGI